MLFTQALRRCLRAAGFLCVASSCWAQTLALTVSPSALTIYPGQENIPVTISVRGNAAPVGITLTGLPSGITASSLTVTAGNAGTLMLSASLSAGQEGFSNQNLSIPTSWTAPVTVYGTSSSAQATAQLPLTVSISNPSSAPAPSAINLPVININTNGVGIVSKTTDVPGTVTITSADGQTSYLPDSATATIRRHFTSMALQPRQCPNWPIT